MTSSADAKTCICYTLSDFRIAAERSRGESRSGVVQQSRRPLMREMMAPAGVER